MLRRRYRNINALSALPDGNAPSELDFEVVGAARGVEQKLVILSDHTRKQAVQEYRVRQSRLVPVAYVSDGQHGRGLFLYVFVLLDLCIVFQYFKSFHYTKMYVSNNTSAKIALFSLFNIRLNNGFGISAYLTYF